MDRQTDKAFSSLTTHNNLILTIFLISRIIIVKVRISHDDCNDWSIPHYFQLHPLNKFIMLRDIFPVCIISKLAGGLGEILVVCEIPFVLVLTLMCTVSHYYWFFMLWAIREFGDAFGIYCGMIAWREAIRDASL
jgi:hypothetical protein